MAHWTRLVISTVLVGCGFAGIMVAIASQLGYNIDPVALGWVFGVLATGVAVRCDDYISRPTTMGGK